jgi:hypothetical protein
MFLEIGLVFMVVLFVASCYVIWNLNTKLESLETWIEDFINSIIKVQTEIEKIDYKGYFEADDEVGQIFNQIKTTVSQLDRFKGEEQ